MRSTLLGVLVLVGGCDLLTKDGEPELVQFNADGDVLEVLLADEIGPPVSIDLHSSTGNLVIGNASADPGSGPVGTDHELVVIVDDEYQDLVIDAQLKVDAGQRGVETYTMRQDSADHGLWVLTLTSLGGDGEQRTDAFTVLLFNDKSVAPTVN